MRTARDRIRHALLFEVIALALVTPFGGALFQVPLGDFGVVAIAGTVIAMAWNYAFNLGFDHAIRRRYGTVGKTLRARVVHAVLFEAGLTCLLVPFVAWYLDVGWGRALMIDVTLVGFYLVYAFAFNWLYDIAFPIREG